MFDNNRGGGISLYLSQTPIITNCIIYHNDGTGLVFWEAAKITCNKIINNTYGMLVGEGTPDLQHNVFAENTSFTIEFGYWDFAHFGFNSFVNNSGFSTLAYTALGEMNFDNNIFVGNYDSQHFGSSIIFNSTNHHYHNNNFFNNGSTGSFYIMQNNLLQGNPSVDATNNYWGTSSSNDIDFLIYDWFDNSQYSVVNYQPFLSEPNIDAPVSPVYGLTKTDLGGNQVLLQWLPNPESDIAGYKVYWGNFTGYSFSNVADVGNVTNFTLSNVNFSDPFSVTAYDSDAGNNNDVCDGHESWFSNALYSNTVGITNAPAISTLNIFPNPSSDKVYITGNALKTADSELIMIYNATGSLIKEIDPSTISTGIIMLDVKNFGDGVYFFIGHTKQGNLLNGKFLVHHGF